MEKSEFAEKYPKSMVAYVALIFLAMFIYGISNQAIGTLISRIIEHYDIKMAFAGLLSSFSSAGNFAAIFVITIFVGRVNKMILMGMSLLFYSTSLYLISVAPPFGLVLATFALIGVFGATTDTLVNSLVADLMPGKISLGISLLHGMFGLGGLCGPIVIERLAANLNWEQVYFIISMLFLTYLVIYAVFVRLHWKLLSTRMSNEKQSGFGLSDIALFFMKKRHVLLLVTVFFYGGNQITLSVWIKRYVETYLNEPLWGAYTLSAMWLGIAICRLFISPLVKASSPIKICVGNFISALALVAGLLSGSVFGIAAASLVVGLSSGLTLPLVLALGCEWNKEKTALGTMVPFTVFFIACVLFPPLSGLISDQMGIPWGVALGAASAILTALFSGILNAGMKKEITVC